MNIFEYLLTDEIQIQEKLHDVANNYSDWPQTKVFELAGQSMNAITTHVQKVNDWVINHIQGKGNYDELLSKWDERTNSIEENINSLTQLHVDEPGFEQLFIHLSKAFDTLVRFTQEDLFPAVKKNADEEALDRMNAQLESVVFS